MAKIFFSRLIFKKKKKKKKKDYFIKWVEAASYSVLKAKHVARFIENNIICRYGVPQEIIFDNG